LFVVGLANPANGARIISSNSTFGQKAACKDLKGRLKFMRALRGPNIVPIVELSSMTMQTRYGAKMRPHFEIIDWRDFGGSSSPACRAGDGRADRPCSV